MVGDAVFQALLRTFFMTKQQKMQIWSHSPSTRLKPMGITNVRL